MKSSGRGFSASVRRNSGVICRLIGTPQIASACASNAARSASPAAAFATAASVWQRRPPSVRTTAASSAHHHDEVLENTGCQERGETVVLLTQTEAVQIARRRLKVIAGVKRHGFPVRPSERLTIQRKEVLEVSCVKVRADSTTRSTLSDDEEKLTRRVCITGEKGVAAESLTTSISEDVRAGRHG